ncbi:hypothetical protein [Amaricoccus solimangrovi]|uniref:Uncharacterized protein n=1 Tax=Amaricoccus solimangrovi TaxID=2589815 RepID=A0A501WV11_9RHOB|nr:hypothetical protein [Amaricoccus solimangrovi]TPE53248.1 hypothetical protein FJM51_04310 [Amaricoccus solimangrovi]
MKTQRHKVQAPARGPGSPRKTIVGALRRNTAAINRLGVGRDRLTEAEARVTKAEDAIEGNARAIGGLLRGQDRLTDLGARLERVEAGMKALWVLNLLHVHLNKDHLTISSAGAVPSEYGAAQLRSVGDIAACGSGENLRGALLGCDAPILGALPPEVHDAIYEAASRLCQSSQAQGPSATTP